VNPARRYKLRHPVRALDAWWAHLMSNPRVDLNFGNIGMLIGLMLPSLSIILQGPIPGAALGRMPSWLQVWMCAFIFIGCGMKLHGALGGRRWYRPNMTRIQCYQWGIVGAPLAASASWVYGYFILTNTPTFLSAVSGVSTPCFGTGILLQAGLYLLEIRRLQHDQLDIITEMKTDDQ
jgi:hypothetical protein